jgi:uncharacterized phiE125 gp8 family phage protein
MTEYNYSENWPSWPGYVWSRDQKIVQRVLPSHGNGFVSVKVPPEVEPISLDEARGFARVDGTSEDTLIELLITAAREAVEGYLMKALVEQTLTLSLDWWPEPLTLPRPPLISVVEVRTVGEDSSIVVYSTDGYFVRTLAPARGQIVVRTGCTPPINTDRTHGGYEVEYKVGYGKDPSDVPASVRHGILMLVTHLYESRVPTISTGIVSRVPGLAEVLGMQRRMRI